MNKTLPILLTVLIIIIISGVILYTLQQTPNDSTQIADEIVMAKDVDEGNFIKEENAVVSELSEFPVYPTAVIKESSKRIKTYNTNQDLKAVWEVKGEIPTIMQWYITELKKQGWEVLPPDDQFAKSEQVANISRDNLEGYIGIEDEGGEIEIVVDFKVVK